MGVLVSAPRRVSRTSLCTAGERRAIQRRVTASLHLEQLRQHTECRIQRVGCDGAESLSQAPSINRPKLIQDDKSSLAREATGNA